MPKPTEPHNRQNLPETKPPYYTRSEQKARISIIATPIGNLGDLSERARTTLQGVDELWCEDTRHTQSLLNAIGVSRSRLKRVDQHIHEDELKKMLESVQNSGQWIGMVSDAGTPGISDPGAKIAELLVHFPGIRLEPIPGASAVSAFVSIAGILNGIFTFQGFFPRSEADRTKLLNDLKDSETAATWIFFESPNRILDSIASLKSWSETIDFAPKFVFAKELTKIHESIWSGEGVQFLEWFQAQAPDQRGEWLFSVSLPKDCVINKKPEADWEVTLECLITAGISTKDAATLISERFLIAKKLAYNTALEIQKKIKK